MLSAPSCEPPTLLVRDPGCTCTLKRIKSVACGARWRPWHLFTNESTGKGHLSRIWEPEGEPVPLSIKEAIATISAPGQPFEVLERVTDGVTNRVFKNAPATVRDFFESSRGLNTTFLVYEDEEWTFDEVMKEVDALAYALVNHFDIKVGDRVGIAMRNLPEWVVSFAAILSVGAISVSLNAWWTEDELDY